MTTPIRPVRNYESTPPSEQHGRQYWAAQARNAIEQARRDADGGRGQRRIWVVVTRAYSVEIDEATETGAANTHLLGQGHAETVVAGLDPVHTEIGFRLDGEGKNITPTLSELALRQREHDEATRR